jgi:hypothetical protein
MTDKAPFDLDAALAALANDERAARPTVSESLQARVLGDAAEVAAERAGAMAPPRIPARSGGFRLFGLVDAWSGAAVAAVVLCLAIGIGVGYGAGSELLAQAGLGDVEVAVAADDSDGFLLSEDVL